MTRHIRETITAIIAQHTAVIFTRRRMNSRFDCCSTVPLVMRVRLLGYFQTVAYFAQRLDFDIRIDERQLLADK